MKKPLTFLIMLVLLTLALGGTAHAYPAGWTSDKAVTAATGAVDLAVKGNSVHLVYGNSGVYYRRSTNKGLTWGSAVRLDAGTGVCPQVTTGSGNTVYAAYVGQDRPGALRNEVLVRRSRNAGQTWDTGYFAYAGSATDAVDEVALTHGSDSVSATWSLSFNASPTSIYWSQLGTGGDLAPGERQVWDTSTRSIDKPRIASDGSNVFVAYMGQGLTWDDWNVYCMRFNGTTAAHDLIASSGSHDMRDPDVSCQGSNLFNVVWTDSAGGIQQVCRKVWNGSSWGGRFVLYNASTQQPAARAMPYSPDNSVICLDSTGSFLKWAMFGSNADIVKGSKPKDWAADRAYGGDAVVASRCADGSVRVKRTDAIAPSSSGVTAQGNSSGGSTYVKANFGITFNAVTDDWNLTGIDPNSDAFSSGVTTIQMKFSDNPEGPWGDLPTDKGSTINNSPWSATVNTSEMGDGLGYIMGIISDTAGNTKEIASDSLVIDKLAPTCNISTNPAHDPGSWRTSPATVTITASDTNPDHVEYKVRRSDGSGSWVPYTAPFSAPEGRNTIFYRALDKSGNSSDPNASLAVWVDTRAPSCTVAFPTTQAYAPVDNTVVIVKGYVDDGAGEVALASIWIDGKRIYEVDGPESTKIGSPWDTAGKALGPHTIQVKGTDAAGRSARSELRTFQLVRNPAYDWYFAEGTTREGFDEYVCVLNPGDFDAAITFDLMLEAGQVITRSFSVTKKSRATYNVRDMVNGEHDVSIHLRAEGQPVVAERPIYFNYHGKWTGGHDAPGTNALSKQYYFAEGTTRQAGLGGPFEEWLCFQNPGDNAATVNVTYMLGTGRNVVKTYKVAPHSRYTADVNKDVGPDQDVSARVDSDQPIAAERPMYFNYRGEIDGGHIVSGARAPKKTWYFAEGNTRPGFTEYLTVQNPGDKPAALDITLYLEDFSEKVEHAVVPARTRATYNVADFVGTGHDVAVKISSDAPVVAERPMYFNYQGKWTGGHSNLGAAELGRRFFFAEGTTRAGFDEWVTVFSSSNGAVAYITLIYPDGARSEAMMYPVGMSHRTTININEAVGEQKDVSVEVTGDNDIVVERPMYFNYGGVWTGGHAASGFRAD